MRFPDRVAAGRALARALAPYAGRSDVIVLGLPRGGVPVAAEVAAALGAPLDVLIVRKLGVPGREELALGAIASGGVRVLNTSVIGMLNIPPAVVEAVTTAEDLELRRRERAYRGNVPFPSLAARVVIVVDDGLATGATMRSAVAAIRQQRPAKVIAAAPVGSTEACVLLAREADESVCVHVPEPFNGVGCWYDDFGQMSDADVREILAQFAMRGRMPDTSGMRDNLPPVSPSWQSEETGEAHPL